MDKFSETIKKNPALVLGGLAAVAVLLFVMTRGGGGGAAPPGQATATQETGGPSIVTEQSLEERLAKFQAELMGTGTTGGGGPVPVGEPGAGGEPHPGVPSGLHCPPGMERDPVSGECVRHAGGGHLPGTGGPDPYHA